MVIPSPKAVLSLVRRLSEYLIMKHGNGQAVYPESGFIDNLYCEKYHHVRLAAILIYLVAHYAEGSLMPILVQRMIFDYVSEKCPFFDLTIVNLRGVFAQLNKRLVEPEIKKHLMMVLGTFNYGWALKNLDFNVIQFTSRKTKICFSRADKNQLSVIN
jgi:glutathione S-transferase